MFLKQRITTGLPVFVLAGYLLYNDALLAQSVSYLIARGNQNLQIGNTKAAIEAYEKALTIEPDNEDASKKLANAYEKSGRLERALDLYKGHLERHPQDAETAFRLATILQWRRFGNRQSDVIRYMRQGLAVKENPDMRLNLARILSERRESIADAKIEYETILSKQPEREDIRTEYLKILIWDPKYRDQAIDELKQRVKSHPEDLISKRKLANLLAADRRTAGESVDLYSQLLEKSPEDITLKKERLTALMKIPQESERAKDEVKEILKKNPDKVLRIYYADLLAGDPSSLKEALNQYRSILNSNAGNHEVRLKYGKLLLAKGGDPKEAIRQFKQVIKQQPQNATAHRGLAHAYAMTGENDLALYHAGRVPTHRGGNDSELKQMTSDITISRRPRSFLKTKYLFRRAGGYSLSGHTSQIDYQGELGPFVTYRGAIGVEEYSNQKSDKNSDEKSTAASGVGAFSLQLRITQDIQVNATTELHQFYSYGSAISADINACVFRDRYFICPGYEIRPIYDSITSLRGRKIQGELKYGGAREVLGTLKVGAKESGADYYSVTIESGNVHSYSSSLNSLLRVIGQVREPISKLTDITFDIGGNVLFMSYQRDELDSTPTKSYVDGYFSPKRFYMVSGRIIVGSPVGNSAGADISIGPIFRYIERHDERRGFDVGKELTIAGWCENLSDDWNFRLEATSEFFPSSEVAGHVVGKISRLF